MKAMRPDQIMKALQKEREQELRSYIFAVLMLVVLPIGFIIAMLFN